MTYGYKGLHSLEAQPFLLPTPFLDQQPLLNTHCEPGTGTMPQWSKDFNWLPWSTWLKRIRQIPFAWLRHSRISYIMLITSISKENQTLDQLLQTCISHRLCHLSKRPFPSPLESSWFHSSHLVEVKDIEMTLKWSGKYKVSCVQNISVWRGGAPDPDGNGEAN